MAAVVSIISRCGLSIMTVLLGDFILQNAGLYNVAYPSKIDTIGKVTF